MKDSQYARRLIEACLDPMFRVNVDGKITDLNNALIEITEMSREKFIGTDFHDYFIEPEKTREVFQHVLDNGFVTNYPLTIKGNKQTNVLCNGSVYRDEQGVVLGLVITARVVTDPKVISIELAEAKNKAEKFARIAEDAVRVKQQFLSNMSHEIRTPLNAIIGFTKVVLKTELSSKQREYLTAIKFSSDELAILINDLLDLAKADAGAMTFERTPFKMATSLSSMLHLFDTKIQEKNLVLVKEYDNRIPEILVGDPVRLHQVILNLVSNAVKFTKKGKITVSVKLLQEDEETASIEFAITDTGIGIAEDKLSTIFEVFQQESNGTSRLYGGMGIGLAIVKQLVEPQGGSISVKSKVDEGSTFSFILTFQKSIANSLVKSETAKQELDNEIKNIKVLVVEDVKLNQLLMKTVLNDFGFECDIAGNGKIAIEKLQTNSYDIVLMDLHMPEMNGFEATEYIRNNMNSKIPIIALTADVTTVDLAKCKASGMNHYMPKPVDEELLYCKIMELVKKPIPEKYKKSVSDGNNEVKNLKSIDLNYLMDHTKSDPKMMMDMISIYLNQTPPLIVAMKQGLLDKDWTSLQATVHKMIPSFSIMGISSDFENIAIKIQEYANNIQLHSDGIPDLVLQLENVCSIACKELEDEFNIIKKTNS